ncbi:MAG: hypothetical protein ACYYKD_06095 [Rhodospirillales bacterium]
MLRRKSVLSAVVVVAAAFGAAGCEPPQISAYPEITFTHQQRIGLNIENVETVNTYAPPLRHPNVEHLVPGEPLNAAKRWAADRIRPAGPGGKAVFTVLELSIKEKPLEIETGLTGALTTDQSERYEAVIEARIEIVSAAGTERGEATARAERSITVPEDATLNERDEVLFKLAEDLMADFNAEMEENIRAHMGGWVVR